MKLKIKKKSEENIYLDGTAITSNMPPVKERLAAKKASTKLVGNEKAVQQAKEDLLKNDYAKYVSDTPPMHTPKDFNNWMEDFYLQRDAVEDFKSVSEGGLIEDEPKEEDNPFKTKVSLADKYTLSQKTIKQLSQKVEELLDRINILEFNGNQYLATIKRMVDEDCLNDYFQKLTAIHPKLALQHDQAGYFVQLLIEKDSSSESAVKLLEWKPVSGSFNTPLEAVQAALASKEITALIAAKCPISSSVPELVSYDDIGSMKDVDTSALKEALDEVKKSVEHAGGTYTVGTLSSPEAWKKALEERDSNGVIDATFRDDNSTPEPPAGSGETKVEELVAVNKVPETAQEIEERLSPLIGKKVKALGLYNNKPVTGTYMGRTYQVTGSNTFLFAIQKTKDGSLSAIKHMSIEEVEDK